MRAVWNHIDDLYRSGGIENPTEAKKDFATQNLYGIDQNARMSWVAKMNMVMHGNGHGLIHHHDALVDSEMVRDWGFKPDTFDVIFTNPPFGSEVTNQDTLVNYELRMGRKSQLTEVLFLERCLRLLKSGGILGIVIPDSVLTNTSLRYVRDFLKENSRIIAAVSVPRETFMPYGSGVKASLLFLQKKDLEGKVQQGDVFMAIAENIGYDATGRSTGKSDLSDILQKFRLFSGGAS